MKRLLQLTTIIGLLFINTVAYGAAPVQVRTIPSGVMFWRPDLEITISVHVERDRDNRSGALAITSENYYSESVWEISGDTASSYYQFTRKGLPPGEYSIVAAVWRVTGKVIRGESKPLKILSPF